MNFEGSIRDMRGKHGNHCLLSGDFIERVKDFFKNLPRRKSHYSQNVNALTLERAINCKNLSDFCISSLSQPIETNLIRN